MLNSINDKITDIGFGKYYNATGTWMSGILDKLGIEKTPTDAATTTGTTAPASSTTGGLFGIIDALKKPAVDKSTDQGLSELLKWSYSGSAYTGGRDWASQLDMMPWARQVMDFYSRDVPNRSSGDKWDDRSDLFLFDAAVRYFKRFQYRKTYTEADCLILQEVIPAIDAEIQSVYSRRAAGAFGTGEQGDFLTVLNDLRTHILLQQAQLTCTKEITRLENEEFLDTQMEQIKAAQSLVTKPSSGSKYLVYGLIGVAAVITVVIVLKA